MNKKIVLFLIIIFLILSNFVFAETIILKSGEKTKGEIVKKTDAYVKLLLEGESEKFIYFLSDEIEKISENIEESAKLANSTEDSFTYCKRGFNFLLSKQYAEAKSEFEHALMLNPDCFEAHEDMGILSYMTGQYEDAINYYSNAVQLKPDAEEAYCGIGSSYVALKQPQKAVEYLEKAISVGDTFYAVVYFQLGRAYYDLKEEPQAKENFLKAKDLYQKNQKIERKNAISDRIKEIDEYLNKMP
ncbi:MAG: tetratricopeptide repeat protein [Candidatus Colwellbacteria bacterium]|nr:tetratricopeptide repeat protein [Candidatus Colwellbacteria bacterium]